MRNTRTAQEDITSNLLSLLGLFANQTRLSIKGYVNSVFLGTMDGPEPSIKEFNRQIGSGVWADTNLLPQLQELNLQTEIATIYYGVLTIPAWYLRELRPLIL